LKSVEAHGAGFGAAVRMRGALHGGQSSCVGGEHKSLLGSHGRGKSRGAGWLCKTAGEDIALVKRGSGGKSSGSGALGIWWVELSVLVSCGKLNGEK
jgi:hypothetical protein